MQTNQHHYLTVPAIEHGVEGGEVRNKQRVREGFEERVAERIVQMVVKRMVRMIVKRVMKRVDKMIKEVGRIEHTLSSLASIWRTISLTPALVDTSP